MPSALKDCVAQDPALTCKVLRVVNSSLYGLNRPVADLNQAIGLMGIKPLKLLVLGFNLPDALFAEVAARELQWYWTNTLTRAVAARLIAEQLWNQPGDEAFIAGLLQDIGILVLLRELGEPYAKFLTGVIEEKCHLASLEQDTLGFDHIQLSAALLARWQLAAATGRCDCGAEADRRGCRGWTPPEGDLPQILHLAEMLMQLVGQAAAARAAGIARGGQDVSRDDQVEAGGAGGRLAAASGSIGARCLSLELTEERDYVQMLLEAHRQMAALSEQIAGEPAAAITMRTRLHRSCWRTRTSFPMRCGAFSADENRRRPSRATSAVSSTRRMIDADRQRVDRCASRRGTEVTHQLLLRQAGGRGNRCRERRQELSLLLVEPNVFDMHADPHGEMAGDQVRRALARCVRRARAGERVPW